MATLTMVCLLLVLLIASERVFAAPAEEITVSAAISLKDAFTDMGKLFETAHGGGRIVFNFGASGDLARQIEGGAPVDIFASAAEKDMADLAAKRFIIASSKVNFARNTIVLVQPSRTKARIDSFDQLKRSDIKKIALGNPKTVPAGRYGEEVLKHVNIFDMVKGRLVYAENVRQVLDYVARDEVDAGIVYGTDAAAAPREVTVVSNAPKGSHAPVIYPMAAVKGSRHEHMARAFINFVTSDEGKRALQKYGFGLVP
jgi:molybdate transport system substrate-binding protein